MKAFKVAVYIQQESPERDLHNLSIKYLWGWPFVLWHGRTRYVHILLVHHLRMPRHSSGIVAASCLRSWSFRIALAASCSQPFTRCHSLSE
jgi:hypothetical protein